MRNEQQKEKTIQQCVAEINGSHQGKASRGYWEVSACRCAQAPIKAAQPKLNRVARRAAKQGAK